MSEYKQLMKARRLEVRRVWNKSRDRQVPDVVQLTSADSKCRLIVVDRCFVSGLRLTGKYSIFINQQ